MAKRRRQLCSRSRVLFGSLTLLAFAPLIAILWGSVRWQSRFTEPSKALQDFFRSEADAAVKGTIADVPSYVHEQLPVESAPPKEERREDSPEEPSVPSTDPAPSPTAAPTVPAPARCKIFTLWEYPREAPLYARLNVEAWRRHARHLCDEPVLISRKNVMKWIPDMPEEFFRFPYHAATSDLIRYALLYHHGGIYMDADFIVLKDLSPIVDRLADHDLISYATVSNPKGVCSDSFSSNFIAGRKGSVFMREMWVKQKKMITKHCPLSDKSKEIVCCFDDPKIECHIPFAGIGEGTSHPMLNQLYKNKVSMKTYCFADEESFVPDHFAYVLEHVPDLEKAYRYLEERNIKRGLDRMAFHMFNSIIPFKNYNCKKLFTKGTTVGQLYLTAFGTGLGIGARAADAAAEAFLKEHPDFQELQAKYEGGWPCKDAHKVAPSVAKFKARAATAPSPAPEASVTTVEEPTEPPVAASADRAGGKCRIYTYWEYEGLGPLYLRLNVESWRRNARSLGEPVIVTTANVREYVPDVPEEFFRLPYPEARADFIKWGLVYNNGGIFMEPDVLMSQDIEEVCRKTDDFDLVSSQEESDGSCTDQFNPAVVAGPPKGIYFKAVWEKHKAMLQHHCPIADKQKEIICCFDDTNERCHIPWLAMNRGIAHPIIRDWSRSEPDRPLRSFCFNRESGFQPSNLNTMIRERWDVPRALNYYKKRSIPRPTERMLYHLQGHGTNMQELDCTQLFNDSTLVGKLYLSSFLSKEPLPSESSGAAQFHKQNPFMKTVRHTFKDGLPCKRAGPRALPKLPSDYPGKEACRIFTLWEYPEKGPPVFKMLNVESWRRHTHGLCQEPVLINDQNVKKWIPDMPEEYFRMPAPAPKSDLIRYALLYHHGGLYMDADFVAVKDMDPILALLHTHDFVSYQEKGEPGQVCSAAFSSNLIGGRRGSPVFKFLWERQKEKLRKKCGHTNPGEACCPENARRQCTVPWAALGEGVTHPAFNELLKTGEIFETFCFADEWSFVPDHFAYSVEHIPSKDEALKYMVDRNIPKPLDRIVYHLFNAITPLHKFKCATLLDPRRLIGHLYTESFRSETGRRPVEQSEESNAWLEEHPEFVKYQQVHNGWQPCPGPVDVTEAPTSAADSEERHCQIFTLWEYKSGPPLSVALNVEGWRRHAHKLCGEPVLISDENVRTYIPDMPTEYFRMPYSQAKSDIIRYALLYHHGGIYMDTDFLVVQDLDEVIDLAQSYDLVSYMDEGSGSLEKGSCSRHFSSNFLASRKGSIFMKEVWTRQKQLMETHCPLSDKEKEKVCCFDDDRTQCHIPWAGIGEGVSHPVFDELEGDGVRFKSFCFSDERGFTPPDMINMLEKVRKVSSAETLWEADKRATARDPWGRIMYHTFNSIMPWSTFGCKQIFDQTTVYGKLNYLSYTTGHGPKVLPPSAEHDEWLRKYRLKRTFGTFPGGLPCSVTTPT